MEQGVVRLARELLELRVGTRLNTPGGQLDFAIQHEGVALLRVSNDDDSLSVFDAEWRRYSFELGACWQLELELDALVGGVDQ